MSKDINILIRKAFESFQNQNKDLAIHFLEQALLIDSFNFNANHIMGVVLGTQGKHQAAQKFLKKATEIDPNSYFAQFNYAKSLVENGDNEKAIIYNENAVKIDSKNKEAWLNYGLNLKNLKLYSKSLECYDKALNIDPNYIEALVDKSDILIIKRNYIEAINILDKILLIDLSKKNTELVAIVWLNRGVIFLELSKYEDSLACLNEAININPNEAIAWCNKGILLSNLKRYDESLVHFDQAIKLEPNYAEAYFNKAAIKLLLGDFESGWNLYKYRWKKNDFEQYRYCRIPKLDSIANVKSKKILIWYEQGLGDTIQFSRYILKLIDIGAEVTFEVQKDLIPFFKNQFDCKIKDISFDNNSDYFDYQTPLLELPYLFKTSVNTIPFNQGYLKVQDKSKIIYWKERLKKSKDKLNIGIAISGNSNHKQNHIRSIPLIKMEPLLEKGNFFLVQKELNNEDMKFLNNHKEINFLGNEINNFSDTAAIVENMDLIISIDTSLIHLAGALGKKSFLLLPWIPEWRWLVDREDSPWYKSIKIFRQKFMGDWNSLVNQIEFELNMLKKNTLNT